MSKFHVIVPIGLAVLMSATSSFAQEHGVSVREQSASVREHRASVRDYYELARERNPMLRAAAAAALATSAAAPSAGLPPDPTLQLGVMNASLPGLRTDMPA